FMAPAITVETFKHLVLPSINAGKSPQPTLYILSDTGERDDDVGPYGKSLLYLVSNAFEKRRETPLLGMEEFVVGKGADPEMAKVRARKVDGLPSLVIAGKNQGPGSESQSDTHGGFDNDRRTLNSVMFRMLGGPPPHEFQDRDLQFESGKD